MSLRDVSSSFARCPRDIPVSITTRPMARVGKANPAKNKHSCGTKTKIDGRAPPHEVEHESSKTQFDDADLSAPASREPRPLDRTLRDLYPAASWGGVRKLVRSGKVRVGTEVVTDPSHLVAGGASITIRMRARRPMTSSSPLPEETIVHFDAHIVVVDKPAGIATVPYEDERDTLDRLIQALLRRRDRRGGTPLGVVQRLDKETSGLIVFARTLSAKRHLQQQFRARSVHRRYLAIAHGRVTDATFRSRLVSDRGDGLRGSTSNPLLGRDAVTHVKVVERLHDATLLECRLETGRTHQIRIHLAEAGHPLLGERVYSRGYRGTPIAAPRLMLHAAELGFTHPMTGEWLAFHRSFPEDFRRMLSLLREA